MGSKAKLESWKGTLDSKGLTVTETKEESIDTELNGHSPEVVKEFCCLNDTVGNRSVSAFDKVLPKTRNGCKSLTTYYLLFTTDICL